MAHLKSSPSDDQAGSETFVFRSFWGRVHDKFIFLRRPTLSKRRACSALDGASLEEHEEEDDEEEGEEEEEVDTEGSATSTSTSLFCRASSDVFFFSFVTYLNGGDVPAVSGSPSLLHPTVCTGMVEPYKPLGTNGIEARQGHCVSACLS